MAAVALNKVSAAIAAPAFVNRLRSEHRPASQVHICDPPSKIVNLKFSSTLIVACFGFRHTIS
ncbi:MAG TPA: hypothetical protein VNI36_02805, partial [Candidatus Dormibacteraeota bacterium]|nr:hypothetical protein [Candidatus Dormibacteraeota bacterium]